MRWAPATSRSVARANNPGSSDDPAVQQTPTPPEIVVVPTKPPEAQAEPIPGTFVYAKDGNIWLQTDDKPQQLTKGGNDSMPTFAPDGKTRVLRPRARGRREVERQRRRP